MSPPWMPLYIADYRADTAHLGAAEHGAYLLLIMHYWQTGGLPDDDRQLARIACMSEREWKRARPLVQAFFDDGWKHGRIEAELKRCDKIISARSEAGAAGASSKWKKAREARLTRSQRLSSARDKGRHTKSEWAEMLAACDNKCVRCGCDGDLVKDHIIPIYQEGSDGIENLQPLCVSCNSTKGPDTTDFRPDGWRGLLADKTPDERLANACRMPGNSQPQPKQEAGASRLGVAECRAPPEKSSRAAVLQPDWQPSPQDIDHARTEGLSDEQISRELAKFRDYWISASGAGARKRDWSATWRNWVRKAADGFRRTRGYAANGCGPQAGSLTATYQRAAAFVRDKNAFPE